MCLSITIKYKIFNVEVITDLDEQLCVSIQANYQSGAEAITVSMLENGEQDCIGRIRIFICAYFD